MLRVQVGERGECEIATMPSKTCCLLYKRPSVGFCFEFAAQAASTMARQSQQMPKRGQRLLDFRFRDA